MKKGFLYVRMGIEGDGSDSLQVQRAKAAYDVSEAMIQFDYFRQ